MPLTSIPNRPSRSVPIYIDRTNRHNVDDDSFVSNHGFDLCPLCLLLGDGNERVRVRTITRTLTGGLAKAARFEQE